MRKVAAIVGPTAVGKTTLAVALAERLRGEIINADSRQVYRHMDIGTSKPSGHDRRKSPHHLLDIRDPDDPFSLGEFLPLAESAISAVSERGNRPFLVGGTGQYIWGLLEGWSVPEVPANLEIRRELEKEARDLGPQSLYRRLQNLDPVRAQNLDPRNLRRVIRALEIIQITGQKPSSLGARNGRGGEWLAIGLTMDRQKLYRRIDDRLDAMMDQGLLAEVKRLAELGYPLGEGPLNGPGYRELGEYLAGKLTLDEAVQRAKFATHRLVRRQYAWFKTTDPRIHWFDAEDEYLVQRSAALMVDFFGAETPVVQ